MHPRLLPRLLVVATIFSASGVALAAEPVFKHPLDGQPIQTPLKPGRSRPRR
ncbi:MAG: hypothetical protein ACLGHY_08140 [Gammaproteobacteria bacterium]